MGVIIDAVCLVVYWIQARVRRARIHRMYAGDMAALIGSSVRMSELTMGELRDLAELLPEVGKLATLPSLSDAPEYVETTAGARIPYSEIPKDADGNPTAEWMDDNCGCGRPHGDSAPSSGLYL